MKNIAVIGGGPAGLRAAEVAALAGASVTVYDAMPSVGRKFLVAGKSGLNLTNAEEIEAFLTRYDGTNFPTTLWREILSSFDNDSLRRWASGLGVETFAASSGKVFPTPVDGTIRAAPLLRRWVERLRELGVEFQTRHRWVGFESDQQLRFQCGEETVVHEHDTAILALGGASWPKTGSNGQWTSILGDAGIAISPLSSANCGWEVDWPAPILEEA
ncbi:MAG: NAD(P)/FAD-dependent oxidoreductase, partial [Planctomycetota bacterium]